MSSAYERALSEIGSNGKFQKHFDITYNFVLAALWVMCYNNIILILTITPHHCELPSKPENISAYLWKLQHIPVIADKNEPTNETQFSECTIYGDTGKNLTIECSQYYYDKTWYESTVPSDNNWVCEKELNVANIFAYTKFGEIIGSLFFGWFGDLYGRKVTYIISLAFLIIGRSLSLLANSSFILFTIGCIISSFPSWSATQSTAIISMETSSPQRRSTIAKLRLVATGIGMCLMPLIYWWLRDWKLFMIATTVTLLPYLLLSWKLIESPQWLWVNQKFKQCILQLNTIAKINKTKLNPNTENDILMSTRNANKTEVFGPLALFSGSILAFNTIFQLCLWTSVSVSYTALLMSSGEKSNGNPFLEFAWQSLVEIPGHIIAAWLADTIGRRYTGATASAVTSFLWIMYSFQETSTASWMNNGWLRFFLVMANRLSITVSYYIINLYNMEIYPTCLRQSGMSVGNVISSAASALAPYILYLGRRFDSRYPGAILALMSLVLGVISTLLLPETLNAKLPETMDDARKFGIQHIFSYSLGNRKQREDVNIE